MKSVLDSVWNSSNVVWDHIYGSVHELAWSIVESHITNSGSLSLVSTILYSEDRARRATDILNDSSRRDQSLIRLLLAQEHFES